jgi:general secretion pathway protein G
MKPAKGFTLIELLIVIAIIGVLAGLGAVSIGPIKNEVKKHAARSMIQTLETALSVYKNDFGIYPDDDDSVMVVNALVGYKADPETPDPEFTGNPSWNGPYIKADSKDFEAGQKNKAMLDPWLSPYRFNLHDPQHNAFTCDIWSPGPNRQDEGGEGDDITNW